MNNLFNNIGPDIQFLFIAIGVILIAIPGVSFLSSNKLAIWSPISVFSIIILYYSILGPTVLIANNLTYFRYVEHLNYLAPALRITLVAIISFLFGYGVTSSRNVIPALTFNSALGLKLGKRLILISFFSLLIVTGTGGLMNQLDFLESGGNSYQGYGGSFRNYLMHSIDFLMPATVLLFLGYLNKRNSLILLLAVAFFAIAIYASQGFRWRLVVLCLSTLMSFHIYRNKRLNLLVYVPLALVFFGIMGVIGMTRNYGSGLNLKDSENIEKEEAFVSGFHETSTFFATGLLVEMVPDKFDYIGFDPVVQAILFPIPRTLWSDKPSGDYIRIYESLYGAGDIGKGVAVMSYGEYYLGFGYIGVFVGYFLLGLSYKKLWLWMLANRSNEAAIILYCIAVCFMYVVISRGYLPQVTMLFCFTVLPAYWLYKKSSFRLRKK